MEIGILDIKGSLPCFENFGDLPTLVVDEENSHIIKDLDMLIIPGGSLIESLSLNEQLKKHILEFDGILFGVCSGFQVLSKRVDIGRKSKYPIFREGLGLLDVEFSPLICTDRVEFKLMDNCIFGRRGDEGKGFHCHTYGDIKVGKGVKVLTVSKVKKLNYRYLEGESYIVSGVYCKKIYGTMVHGFLDNENIKKNLLENLGIDEEEYSAILSKNRDLKERLRKKSVIYNNRKYKEDNKKRGVILLSTGSQSGKTFLLTGIVSKLDGKTFVAKIGPDVRDIVPSLYLLREPMLKYSSIKIGDRGWCDVEEFLKFVRESDYKYYIVEGVMGAFTGALREKNYSSAEVSKLLGFPVYIVSSCSKGGIEGAFLEGLSYYFLLKDMGVDVRGVILNRVYNFEIFEKVKKIGEEIGVKVIGVKKVEGDERGLIPEVEIDYERFCRSAMELDVKVEIPPIDINKREEDSENFEYYLRRWSRNFLRFS